MSDPLPASPHDRSAPQDRSTPRDAPVRYGAMMLRRFGWFYRLLGLGRALDRVRFEDHSAEHIRDAVGRGPVVYVLLRASALDHLALNAVLNRRRLPLSRWANGVRSFWWQPVREAWSDVFVRLQRRLTGRVPDPVTSGWLAAMVADDMPATVFLGEADPDPGDDPLTALLDAQRRCARPIQLVPVMVVWNPAPAMEPSLTASFLAGGEDEPGLWATLRGLYWPPQHGPFVQAGRPLDLAELTRRTAPEQATRALRTVLRRYLKREAKVVRGPTLLPYNAMRQIVLDNPPMRRFAEDHAKATGRTAAAVRDEMAREYKAIAAHFSFAMIRFLSWTMRPLWERVYSGYDIRPEDLERIREAARRGAPVLVPCHKSHFDYLLMSWVCYHGDVIVPHVVAGINLAIWPVSIALRACGGFFIKRSFTGEAVHEVVFARYLRELLLHGYTVEFFIEGGRTRTGLLLRPKLGVLGMVVDAAALNPDDTAITLLPVAISYEQVAEEGAYRRELGGAEKQTESMGQLIRASSVLSRRFGRVYVRVGEPIVADDIVPEGVAWSSLDEAAQRPHLRLAAERLMHRIGRVTVVLPTGIVAAALLAHHRQGIHHAELVDRVERLAGFVQAAGAELAASLRHFDAAIVSALDRFARDGLVRQHAADGERVWEIVPSQRVMLDFHKNQIAQFFTDAALTTAVIRGVGGDTFGLPDLEPGWALLGPLLRRELIFDPDASDEARLRTAVDQLVAWGGLEVAPGAAEDAPTWRVKRGDRLGELHGLMRGLLESYLVVGRAVCTTSRPVDPKAMVKEVQGASEAWLAAGTLTRPEALGVVSLGNALRALPELGLARQDGKLIHPDKAALEPFLAQLGPMVEG